MGNIFKGKERIISIIAAIVFTILLVTVISNKVGYHIDEINSYTRANHTDGHIGEEGICYSPASEPYIYKTTALADNRFNYIQVWKTAGGGVHPPIFYFLLHTLCSFTPGVFNMWYAGGINILFAVLTLFVFRMLLKIFVDDAVTRTLITVFYITNYGILSINSFFRMYIIAMFWVTLLAYFFLDSVGKPWSRQTGIKLFLTTVAGALTHYYCIVFAVLISACYAIYLLVDKRKNECGKFCITMIFSGMCSVGLFPYMIRHMFFGHRGEEAIENLSNAQDYADRLVDFFGYISKSLFGKGLHVILIGIVVLFVLSVFVVKGEKKEADNDKKVRYLLLICSTVLYFLMVSKMASYIHERYIMPIYTICILWVICLLLDLLKRFMKTKAAAIVLTVIMLLVSVSGYYKAEWTHLRLGYKACLEALEPYSGTDCVCIYDNDFKRKNLFSAAKYFGSLIFVCETNDELLDQVAKKQEEPCILVIFSTNKEELLKKYLEHSNLTNAEEIYKASNNTVYYYLN